MLITKMKITEKKILKYCKNVWNVDKLNDEANKNKTKQHNE